MTFQLPSRLLECIFRAETSNRIEFHRITKEKLELYVQSVPEFFNEITADHIALVHARYGYNQAEHSDWVYPTFCCSGGETSLNNNAVWPLNSWVLKYPVDKVPSFAQIEEEFEWCFDLLRVCDSAPIQLRTAEEIHERYVSRVCGQVYDHTKLLSFWREAGCPREQQDCYAGIQRKEVKKVLNSQKKKALSAKDNYLMLKKYCAPEFLSQEAYADYAIEQAICDQLSETMRFC